ncbi:hypothetical protein ACTQ33_12385 [Candidatus Avoscillospira sp. LCP25S3_F1]|uniref:hypothetical protein n=1 Tax=Candidatus Avoscillospira sp. LCP25S3_F1 TaxID=3438825 RepID=UPI003F8FB7D8
MMKQKQFFRRLCASLVAAAVTLSLLPPVSAANSISIASLEDWKSFTDRCVRDTYSQGLTVELTADLDFTDHTVEPVPIFQGTFHGNGHTITGWTYTEKGSTVGLFRTVTATAVVDGLTLDATVSPGGTASTVGLLCGDNFGILQNCTVRGTLSAQTDTGGIAGCNEESGQILNCISHAHVTAVTNGGGIVGRNLGTVSGCINIGILNDDPDQTIPTSIGGIAGLSRGTLTGCRNQGAVGYDHLGYNMGGIVGLQSGTILDCTNSGTIRGRKDVGGIVGQFEPSTHVTYGPSPADQLNDKLTGLMAEMTSLTDRLYAISSSSVDDVQVIHNALAEIQKQAHSAGTESLENVQELSDQLHIHATAISDAITQGRAVMDGFQDTAHQDIEELLKASDAFSDAIHAMAEQLDDGLRDTLHTADIASSDIHRQVQAIQSAMNQMDRELTALHNYVETVISLFNSGDLLGALTTPLPDMNPRGNLNTIGTALVNIGSSLDTLTSQWSTIYKHTSDQLGQEREQARQAAEQIRETAGHLNDAAYAMTQSLSSVTEQLQTNYDAILDLVKTHTDSLNQTAQDTGDAIDAQLEILSDQVQKMTDKAATDTDLVHDTTTALLNQLDQVRQAIYDMGREPELTVEEVTDITEGPGLLSGCIATGDVFGDSNTGGLVGVVSTELGDDPEATFSMDDMELLSDVYATLRAVIRDSRFDGTVTVRNDCGGGIVGRSESGAIVNCVARGTVETGTDYCGGIAGRTKGIVTGCAALVDLSGDNWVGGIAGLGADISGCRTMVRDEGGGEYRGAIAGQSDGTLTDNRYLMEDLPGLDGVDYADRAQGLDFASFSQLSGVPADFLHFSYRYVVDGKTIAEIPFSYDGNLDESKIPAVPQRDGSYGQWPECPTEHLTRSMVLEAQFTAPTATLSSGGAIPALLVQGDFGPDASLHVTEEPLDGAPTGAVAAYGYTIENFSGDTVTLRLRAADCTHPAVYLWQDGQWQTVDTETDGSYLICTAPANSKVLLTDTPTVWPIPAAIGGAAVIAVVVLLLVHRRKRAKSA